MDSVTTHGVAYAVAITVHTSTSSIPALMVPMMVCYGIGVLIESSIHPFDVLEAEPEIVSGYYVDYGSIAFMVIYLGEGVSISW